MMDKFFDCLNVRNTEEHKINLKSFLRPYRNVNDVRFAWLDEFLQHLENWKTSTPERVGNFSQRDREAMFLPWQTYEALRMTILSLKGVVPYLLTKGLKYVLSEKFCQDDIESYFGRQRAIGWRKDKPNVKNTGYTDNTVKSQLSVQPVARNVLPGASKWNSINDAPLTFKEASLDFDSRP